MLEVLEKKIVTVKKVESNDETILFHSEQIAKDNIQNEMYWEPWPFHDVNKMLDIKTDKLINIITKSVENYFNVGSVFLSEIPILFDIALHRFIQFPAIPRIKPGHNPFLHYSDATILKDYRKHVLKMPDLWAPLVDLFDDILPLKQELGFITKFTALCHQKRYW